VNEHTSLNPTVPNKGAFNGMIHLKIHISVICPI